MNNRTVTIYISDHDPTCTDLLKQMDAWKISYQTKNISRQSEHLKELQEMEIFGTPATFIEGEYKAILGFQKEKLKHALGIPNRL